MKATIITILCILLMGCSQREQGIRLPMHVVRIKVYDNKCYLDIGLSQTDLDYITTDGTAENCSYVVGQEIK